MPQLLIIGGGHAAAQLCGVLTEAAYPGEITLVCEEAALPYHRPPLSKGFLKQADDSLQPLRGDGFFDTHRIDVQLGDAARTIDRERRVVKLRSGRELAYDQLVLATGARPRPLPGLADGLQNVVLLRSAEDAQRLRLQLAEAQRVLVIGGGFIGLELAATARALGKRVTVLETAPRLLARAVSPELSAHVLATHIAAGIDIRVDVPAAGLSISTENGRVTAVQLGEEFLPLDLLVVGIGATPDISLALAAGLDCANGVLVDAHMRSSDPAIFAIGDCCAFPYAPWGEQLRLESVQNAHDQARTVAATLLDRPKPYTAVPWFWSEQGSMRLQMTGLARPTALRLKRPGATPQSFSILHYEDGRLVCVESVNAPMDHLAAKKLLELGRSPAPAIAIDPAIALKTHTA